MIPVRKDVVDAVWVTYHPDIEILRRCVASLAHQVRRLHIIDNSPLGRGILDDFESSYGNVKILYLEKNVGIAAAQNFGMRICTEDRCELCILSDQDTFYPDNYVASMLAERRKSTLRNIAAIAPSYFDTVKSDGSESFFLPDGISSKKLTLNESAMVVPQAIASGMMIDLVILPLIGEMAEDLFIDWVDFEWCWRAASRGYVVLGCRDVMISHALGDSFVTFFGRKYGVHSPIRNYYIIRNAMHIGLRVNYLPVRRRLALCAKSLRYFFGWSVLGGFDRINAMFCFRGLVDGIFGRLGQFRKKIDAPSES